MTRAVRLLLAAPVTVGLLLGDVASLSFVPDAAEARPWDRGGRWERDRGGRWDRDRDRLDLGDILVGAAVIAGVVAVASSVLKDRDRDYDGDYGDAGSRSSAIDACTNAATAEARRDGYDVRVRNIDDTERNGDEWRVRGSLDVQDGDWEDGDWRDRDDRRTRDALRFSCSARDGRVLAFRFGDDGYGYGRGI